jgi:hypothetical protein
VNAVSGEIDRLTRWQLGRGERRRGLPTTRAGRAVQRQKQIGRSQDRECEQQTHTWCERIQNETSDGVFSDTGQGVTPEVGSNGEYGRERERHEWSPTHGLYRRTGT